MRILGRGHHSIVTAINKDLVEKFYGSLDEARKEERALKFLNNLSSKGFDIGCKIPEFIGKIERGNYCIDNKNFRYKSRMSRIRGQPTKKQKISGNAAEDLAKIIAALHIKSRPFFKSWTPKTHDRLLRHIVGYKAALVLEKSDNQKIKAALKDAVTYLTRKSREVQSEWTLSHLDINPTNVLIHKRGSIEGLVDWGSFGVTHPSISLYQLLNLKTWPKFRKEYTESGLTIREDLLYAASVIHFAWVPFRRQALGLEPDFKRSFLTSRKYYKKFNFARRRVKIS